MRNKNNLSVTNDARENRMVRKDFTFVIVLNLILFGVLVGSYFLNRSTGQLDQMFSQIIKF